MLDTRRLLKLITGSSAADADIASSSTGARCRRRLVHALYKLRRYAEAESACREWLQATLAHTNADMYKVLERYRTVIQMANGQKSNQRISVQRLDDEMAVLDVKLETWATHNLPQDRFSRITKVSPNSKKVTTAVTGTTLSIRSGTAAMGEITGGNVQRKLELMSLTNGVGVNSSCASSNFTSPGLSTTSCTYCALTFGDRQELRAHCQTEQHQNVIMSDEGKCFLLSFSATHTLIRFRFGCRP